jgi:hypothetical protein
MRIAGSAHTRRMPLALKRPLPVNPSRANNSSPNTPRTRERPRECVEAQQPRVAAEIPETLAAPIPGGLLEPARKGLWRVFCGRNGRGTGQKAARKPSGFYLS